MKKIIFIIGILLRIAGFTEAQNPNKIVYIKIAHIGESDKPIKTLIITALKGLEIKHDELETLILVDNKTFRTVIPIILQSNTNAKHLKKQFYEFGCFNVSLYGKQSLIKSYDIKSREESRQYFNKLINVLTEKKLNQKLIDEINYFERRID